jgi:uncharacterized membrane protein
VQEAFIEAYESQLEDFWQHHGADMTSRVPSTTFDRFKYARGLVSKGGGGGSWGGVGGGFGGALNAMYEFVAVE